ncbi:MAG: MFS transporter [Bacteroidota bacterium]|nr:MFS transporter [Candidatus Kapabacteria bacterium]MCS7303339.1 MFS transporter [Candidatus Kapabacteria bacterium]MCX7937181.1 MFS transporter [Chlorobiota bacterium]MDW8075258.1 MFS transporter [Bacteroidota bacterium]MDW8271871.1 MFS transporter [Bacteroidota bacterium]
MSRHLLLIATIFALTLMVGVGTSTMPPALAAVQRQFGVTPDVAGVLLSVFTLPGLVLTPLLGYGADRLGRRTVLIGSLAVFGIGGIAALWASHFEHLVFVRLLQGIGAAALGALNVTLISDFFSGTERVRLLGYNHSVLSIGTAVLPVISGFLAAIEWRLPFALPAVGLIVAIAVAGAVPSMPHSQTRSESTLGTVQRPLIVLLVVSVITYGLLFGPFLNYVQERIRSIEPTSPVLYQQIGFMVGAMSVATTIAALFVGRLSERVRLIVLLRIACLLYAAAMVLFLIMPTYALLLVPTVLFGIAQAFNQPVVQALVAALAPPHRLATVLSLNRTAALLGQTLGPLVFGVVYRGAGIRGVFLSGALFALIAALILRTNEKT